VLDLAPLCASGAGMFIPKTFKNQEQNTCAQISLSALDETSSQIL
jgi:hypothetical protein